MDRIVRFAVLAGCTVALAHNGFAADFSTDQRGNFALIGNTLGYDCRAAVPAPLVGTVGACGANTADLAPDVFWRADAPAAGQAQADTTITAVSARSTAVLALPAGAVVTFARLYWAAQIPASVAGAQATFEPPAGAAVTVTAGNSAVITDAGGNFYYQSSADVTDLVAAAGSGVYRVGAIDSIDLVGLAASQSFVGWGLIVFYQRAGDPPRHLALSDDFDLITAAQSLAVTTGGFVVPGAAIDGRLGVIAWHGSSLTVGAELDFDGVALSDALNPANNFFNGTRSALGAAVTTVGDLPQVTGGPESLSGMDLDVVDVSGSLTAGDATADIAAVTAGKRVFVGPVVTSLTTLTPLFSGLVKTAADLSQAGVFHDDDQIEYTIVAANDGNDDADGVVLSDALPAGVTFVPGSIQIAGGPNAGPKTDAAGDDQAEFQAATRTIIVRLGAGADAAGGGTIAPGDPATTVKFRVTVDATTIGPVANQARLTCAGALVGLPLVFRSSDGSGRFAAPTIFTVVPLGADGGVADGGSLDDGGGDGACTDCGDGGSENPDGDGGEPSASEQLVGGGFGCSPIDGAGGGGGAGGTGSAGFALALVVLALARRARS